MSERAQINVTQGNKVIRIYSGWGIPRNILPALRAAAKAGHSRPLDIAREIIRQIPDTSFGLRIVANDEPKDTLAYRYSVDVSSKPWRVQRTKMPHYKLIDNGNGTASVDRTLQPAVTRTIRVTAV